MIKVGIVHYQDTQYIRGARSPAPRLAPEKIKMKGDIQAFMNTTDIENGQYSRKREGFVVILYTRYNYFLNIESYIGSGTLY